MRMNRKALSIIMLMLTSTLTSTLNIQPSSSAPDDTMLDMADLAVQSASAQGPSAEWNRTYGGVQDEKMYSMIQTSDGGYAMAGYTDYFGNGTHDLWLVKTDSTGDMVWNRTYGMETEYMSSLVQTNDGGYAIAGFTRAYAGRWDSWLIETDSNGNVEWNRTYGGERDEQAYSLVQTSDGGYAMAGSTTSPFGKENYWLVKTDSFGSMEWNKTYGGTNHDFARSVIQTSDGGYAMVGYTDSFGAGYTDVWLVKTDSAGNMQWNQTYGDSDYEYGISVVQTTDGGYALGCSDAQIFNYIGDFWLIKTDSSGNMEWNKEYGSYLDEDLFSLIRTSDGGYAMAGRAYPYDNFQANDFWLVKTDSSGNMKWNRTYGGEGNDWAYSLVQTSDGGYAIAGYTDSFGAGGYDFWLIKLAPPVDDLWMVSIEPVQVVLDAEALVMNKKTVLRVEVFSTYSSTQNVDIEITYNFDMPPSPLTEVGVQIEPGLNTLYLPETSFLYWTQTGTDNNIKVKILHDDANPNNNEKTVTPGKEVVESKQLKILVVPVYFPTIGQTPFWYNVDANMIFLEAIYPIADDGLVYEPSSPMSISGTPGSVWFPPFVLPLDLWLYLYVALPVSLSARLLGYDRAVIVIQDIGQGWGGWAPGVLWGDRVPVFVVDPPHYATVAHEIGHTYCLWHPHDIGPQIGSVLHPPLAQRFWVANRDYDADRFSSTFMSYDHVDIDPSTPQIIEGTNNRLWIDKGRYDSNPKEWNGTSWVWSWNLFDQLTVEGTSSLLAGAQATQDAVLIRGQIFKNGTVLADESWYRTTTETLDLLPGGTGNYSIVLLDDNEQVLSEIPFNATFSYLVVENGTMTSEEVDFMPFVFNIPYTLGTSFIQIQNASGYVFVNKTLTPNQPTVNLTFPNGAEILEAGLNYTITWDASDLDGDTLTYTLACSSDGGQNWSPLAIDLEGNSYVWNTSYLQKGTDYLVKVVATDGVNTGEDVSNSTFTVKVHDIVTTDVTSSKVIVGEGYNASANVTVVNEGDFTETFNVTAYANSTAIGMREVTLGAGSNITVTFDWDTTGYIKGNYTMSAVVAPVELEFYTLDNTLTNGIVMVTVPGDVNGDRIVDIFDIGTISSHWYPGPPVGPLNYHPNADINNDLAVDIFDIGIVSAHWGETW